MAALTWREMTAPDLSTSLKGYDQFTNLLNQSLGGARSAIDGLEQKQKDFTNNQVQLALATTQDPAALKAALVDPAQRAKLDPSVLSAQTIAAIGARPGQLTQQANQELLLKDSTRLFDQAVTADARAPLLAQARDLNRQVGLGVKGAREAFTAFTAANPDLVSGLGYKTTSEFQKGLEDAQKSGQDFTIAGDGNTRAWNQDSRAATELKFAADENNRAWGRYGMDKQEFGFKVDDRRDQKSAEEALARTIESSDPNDPESVRQALFTGANAGLTAGARYRLFTGLPPQLQAALGADETASLAAAANGGNAGGAGGGGAPGGSGSGLDGGRVMGWSPASDNPAASVKNKISLIAGKVGAQADVPLSKQQFLSLDMTQLEGKPAARNNFGNMKNTDGSWKTFNSPQEYSAAQRAWLERRWNEGARSVTDAVLGYRPGGGSTPAVQAGIVLRRGQDVQGKTDAAKLIEAGGVEVNPLDVASRLKATPRFKETSPKFIKEKLDDIVKRGTVVGPNGQRIQRITYGQAGLILEAAARENNGSDASIFGSSWFGGVSGRINKAGDRLNTKFIDNEVTRLTGNNLPREAAREADFATASAQVAKAQADADAATRNWQRLTDRARSQPNLAQSAQTAGAKAAEMQRRLAEVKRQNAPSTQPVPVTNEPTFSQRAAGMWDDITGGGLFKVRRQ